MSLLGGASRGAIVAATSVLALASLTLVPSARADTTSPSADCPTAFPEAQVVKDQTVHGLTVSTGTTPESFTGTVLGVMKQGIDNDTDMIIMRLDSPAIEAAGGIWEGMSGSPVYDDTTGQLIGAVAYGLAGSASPIAGITPYADMDEYLPQQPVQVSGRIATRIAKAADVTTSDASSLVPLATPLSVGGVSAARMRTAAAEGVKVHTGLATGRFGKSSGATGTGDVAPASTLVAGGNMAAMLVWGDVAEGGVGTVTSVCNGGIVGFGHPLDGTGDAKVALMSADAVYVQPDLSAPFKVANLGEVAGTIAQDRTTGISGTLGDGPDAASFSSTASYRGRTRQGISYAADPQFWADAVYGESGSNGDTVIAATIPGSAATSYTISGVASNGTPFTISHDDHYLSGVNGDADIAGDVAWDLGDLLYSIGGIDGVHLTSVTMSADYNDLRYGLHIAGVQQKVGGAWVGVSRKRPVLVRAGRTARLRIVLTTPGGDTSYEPTRLTAPKRAGAGALTIVGGNTLSGGMFGAEVPAFGSVGALQKWAHGQVGHDQVKVTSQVGAARKQLVLGPLDRVVSGRLSVPVLVG